MGKFQRALAIFLALFLLSQCCALAETVTQVLPSQDWWGLSRTRFKQANGNGYLDIELEGFKSLKKNTQIDIDGYEMEAYYEFGTDMGSYYGLSKVVYMLDVAKKISNSNLEKCYSKLIKDIESKYKASESTKTSSLWDFNGYAIEIKVDKQTDFNGSSNKTVAIIITESAISSAPAAPTAMRVNITASCSNYNHVGNNWYQEFYINGSQVNRYSQINLSVGDVITVRADITEDDKSPDFGSEKVTRTITQSDLTNGFTISFIVDVSEDRGRYSGYTAQWNVKFTFAK